MKKTKVKDKPLSISVKTKYNAINNYAKIDTKKKEKIRKKGQVLPKNIFVDNLDLVWPQGKPVLSSNINKNCKNNKTFY